MFDREQQVAVAQGTYEVAGSAQDQQSRKGREVLSGGGEGGKSKSPLLAKDASHGAPESQILAAYTGNTCRGASAANGTEVAVDWMQAWGRS
jgi:hypothetical protein